MIRILSDTSTLYSTTQAREAGFAVSPLSVTINGETYREFDEISSEDFTAIIRGGHLPVSSQPAVGEVLEMNEAWPEDEIINISMAAGLSGTCDSAVAAAELCDHKERITVINTRTLRGPHRYLVEKAVEWAKKGHSVAEIKARLEEKMNTAKSFLMPADFDYLRRGGRLSPLVSHVGKVANLVPVMTQTEDGRRLTIAGVRRGFPQGVKFVSKALEKLGVGSGWRVYITHADARQVAENAAKELRAAMPEAIYEILPLSPAFITQGGPGCVAIQAIQC